jgi:hypothetical protein
VKKPRKSSTKPAKGSEPGLGIKFETLLPPPEIWNHMRDCEARHWLRRFREIASTSGGAQARQWWQKTCEDIEKRRGPEALADLRRRMNEQKVIERKEDAS